MSLLRQIINLIFQWSDEQSLDLILARPTLDGNNFIDKDCDIVINSNDIQNVIEFITSHSFIVTCLYNRSDGISCYFYNKKENFSFHINFITVLEVRKIPFLTVSEVISRRIKYNNIYFPEPIDQLIISIVTHSLKQKSANSSIKNDDHLLDTIKKSPIAVLQRLQHIMGVEAGTSIFDDILTRKKINISFTAFLLESWKNYGPIALLNYFLYFFTEIYRRYKMPVYHAAFLGAKGAGKTSLLNEVEKKISQSFPIIKIIDFPLEPTASNILNYYLNCLLINIFPRNKPTLYLHDGYISNILVEPVQNNYRSTFTQLIVSMFPKPFVTVLVDSSPIIALNRNKNVSQHKILQQIIAYKKLPSIISNLIVVNGNTFMSENVSIVEDAIIQSINSQSKPLNSRKVF